MDYRLNGLRALVSGSSRGLGFATARLLAQEGALVTINGRNEARLEQAATEIEKTSGRKPCLVVGDIAHKGVPERVVQEAVQKMGGLDLLATNAGGPPSGRFEDFDDEKWQTAFELCFMGHVRLIRAAIPHLRQSQNPSVLTFTSYSAKQPIPNLVLSNSLRAGVLGLTKSLALEYGAQGIRFNSILPAWTETERVVELMTSRAQMNGTTLAEEIQKQSHESPFGRMGSVEEFAQAAVFLLSPISSYITGVMLTVDGGMYKATI